MNNTKLIQLIRESIQEYVRNIDEAGNMAALEAKMNACSEAIEERKKKINMDGIDETMHEMIDKKKVKELEKEIKHLEKSLAKYEKQLEKMKNKGKKSEEPTEEKKEIVDEINLDETFPEAGSQLEETELNESFLHMQKLAGLITEAEYKQKLNEAEDIASFLNANMDEFKQKVGNPGSSFEIMGDAKVATAGKGEAGIDVSFDKGHMLKLFPENDPYNKVQSVDIAGKTIYYNDYR